MKPKDIIRVAQKKYLIENRKYVLIKIVKELAI